MIPALVSSPLRIYLVALFAGLALPLAFAPFEWGVVAIISLVLLFGIWHFVTPAHAFRSGYLFGLGAFGAGVSWVFVSMQQFGGVPVPLAAGLTTLFVAFLALFPAVAGWCYVRWFRSASSSLPVLMALPALWTLQEWVRGWIFTGFPWLDISYSQVGGPLAGYAPLLGSYGVSWLTAVVSAAIVAALARRLSTMYATVVVVLVVSAGFALNSASWTTPTGKPLDVALLQGNIAQDLKWRPEQRQPTVDLYVSMTREHLGADLIIWPETAFPAFYHQARHVLDELAKEAAEQHTELLIGIPVMEPNSQRYFNSMVRVGAVEQMYSKQHLVPFGEYIPLAALIGRVMEIMQVPLPDFSVMPTEPVLQLAGQPMGISICYEDAFGSEVIRALPAATVLINASNDAWFGDSLAPHQHMQIARMRALETRRPMLRVTNTGVTAIVDHLGNVTKEAPQFASAALRGTVQPMSGTTLYARGGNIPLVAILVVLCAGIFWRGRVRAGE